MNSAIPRKRSLYFLFGILLISLVLFSIVIGLSIALSKLSQTNQIPVKEYQYIFDNADRLEIDDAIRISNLSPEEFTTDLLLSDKTNKDRSNQRTFGSHWVWLVPSTLPPYMEVLMLDVAWLDRVSIYYVLEDGSYKTFQAGDDEIFNLRPIQTRKPAFPLLRELKNSKVKTIYLKISAQGAFSLPLFATSTENLRKNTNVSYFFYGAWIAVLISIAAYNAALFFSLRDNTYLHYVFYIAAYVALLVVSGGLAQQYFWPNSSGVTTLVAHISLALVNAATAFFVINFLKLDRSNTITYNTLTILGILSLACIPFVFPYGYYALIPILISSFAIMGFTIPASMSKSLEGSILAPFMLLSTIILFPSNTISLFRFMGAVDNAVWGEYIVEICMLVDALILSMGLAYRVSLLTKERDSAFKAKELSQQQFAEQLIEAREQEKKSIGQALHDSLGHKILSVKMAINAIDDNTHSEAKVKALDLIDEAVDETRNLSHILYPTVLDHLGLEKAMLNMARKIFDRCDIKFAIRCTAENIDNKTRLFLYRASQECINNLVKHSNATRFELSIKEDSETKMLYFSAKDDGKANIEEASFGQGLTMLKQHSILMGGDMYLFRDNSGFNNIQIILLPLSEQ